MQKFYDVYSIVGILEVVHFYGFLHSTYSSYREISSIYVTSYMKKTTNYWQGVAAAQAKTLLLSCERSILGSRDKARNNGASCILNHAATLRNKNGTQLIEIKKRHLKFKTLQCLCLAWFGL